MPAFLSEAQYKLCADPVYTRPLRNPGLQQQTVGRLKSAFEVIGVAFFLRSALRYADVHLPFAALDTGHTQKVEDYPRRFGPAWLPVSEPVLWYIV